MSKALPLSDRIVAALKAPDAAPAIYPPLLSELLTNITMVVNEVDALDAAATDPMVTDAKADEARGKSLDKAHQLKRLRTAHAHLSQKHRDRLAEEDEVGRSLSYDAATAERDRLVEEIRFVYPEVSGRLSSLLGKIVESDARVREVNQARPKGAARLRTAEEIARGVDFLPPEGLHSGSGWLMPLNLCVRLPHLDVERQRTAGYLFGSAVRL